MMKKKTIKLGKKYLIALLFSFFLFSCTPSFQTPHYRRRFNTGSVWKRKTIPVFNTGNYRDLTVKPETRREMIKPKTINLDNW